MSEADNGEQGRLHGQAAIVTGGSGGIGRAVCRTLAAEGAAVVVVDIDASRVEETVEEIKSYGPQAQALGLVLDVSREQDMEEMARLTLEHFGRIDMLIACAGILRIKGGLPKPLVDLSTEEYEQVTGVNLKGVFLSNRAVLRQMIRQRSGNIVNVSSTSGRHGKAHDSVYCASKFGVIGLSEAVAEEVRQYGIRVQVILPDAVDTPIWDQNGSVRPEQALDPQRVADLILYLVTLPGDTVIIGPVLAPFRTRRRVRPFNRQKEQETETASQLPASS